jgi:hypothetical protein
VPLDRSHGARPGRLLGGVGPDHGRTHHRLGDGRQQLGHPQPHDVVPVGHPVLDRLQHEHHREDRDDRDQRQAPVVGRHDHGDREDDGGVDEPRHATPRQELGELLDVARHPRHQRATPLVGLGRQRKTVDVPEGPRPKRAQRRLAGLDEAPPREPPGERRPDHQHEPERSEDGQRARLHAAVDEAAVEDLLDQDR